MEKRLKYIDFVDIYSALDDNEKQLFAQHYPQENQHMAGLTERLTARLSERLLAEGRQQGIQRGELELLIRLLTRRFGPLAPQVAQRLQRATTAELERWADNILDARTLEEVFGVH
jgi:hypothetical protein